MLVSPKRVTLLREQARPHSNGRPRSPSTVAADEMHARIGNMSFQGARPARSRPPPSRTSAAADFSLLSSTMQNMRTVSHWVLHRAVGMPFKRMCPWCKHHVPCPAAVSLELQQ